MFNLDRFIKEKSLILVGNDKYNMHAKENHMLKKKRKEKNLLLFTPSVINMNVFINPLY